ncbi:MAG: hypothetical protein KC468_34520, partial [Myxococcales bacterium]|nr:hypothetical protein [Myxococcales bacterium]
MSFFSDLFGRRRESSASSVARPEFLPYIEAPQGERAIELQRVEIRARVTGVHAETSQTLHFHNPNRRALEGELVFPLPDGAVVTGYALDVDGRLVDGVVVPRREARRILEAEARKGVDPGLVEQVQGNIYRTRVYPIPARGGRTVRVTYVSELNVQGDDAGYHLPLADANAAAPIELRVEVVQAPVEPVLSEGLGNLALTRFEERWVAEATLPRGLAGDDLQIRLPRLPPRFTAVERRAGDGAFFCVSARMHDEPGERAAFSPRRVAIAWDASGSRADTRKELELLRELLRRWRALTIDLVVARDACAPAERFVVKDGRCDALLERLAGASPDGGTDLEALDLGRAPHPDVEAWLLFTDGLGTVRRGAPALGRARVFCINSQAASHGGLLEHVARANGGGHLIDAPHT